MALQKLDKIELKPKPVTWAGHFSWSSLTDAEKVELATIVDSIQRGYGIPNSCYRAGLGATPDELLAKDGIMHIHLGGKTSDSLIYLMQFNDEVVLVRAGGHLFHEPHKSQLRYFAGRLKREADRRAKAAQDAKSSKVANSVSNLKKPKPPKPET